MIAQRSKTRGWTFVEMLVAVSISAIFMGAASLVLASITANSKRLSTVLTLDIGGANKLAFYGQGGSTVRAYAAPNFGRAAFALEFRELFREDIETASFIHCLPRTLVNNVRPEFLRYEAGDAGSTVARPRLDTPENFRQFLVSTIPSSATIYDTAIRNVPAANRPNSTIFMIAPSEDPGYLRVKAVYEIDFVTVAAPAGTYATVRRYKNGSLTHYYDVFYETGAGSLPVPSFVAFERTARAAVAEGTPIDRFKVADWIPFYLVWLPDPAVNPHKVANAAATAAASSPLSAYEHLGRRSSLNIVVPMFPNL
ncbi:MAG: prepilin-type N-terminal cleavage/methylation domain-containing protein [Verrucomicrobiales bacterium]|nr:prepilin-type N-terminal cleavage/methylation domain-containing protein [Verrucomicrobiales bacterium]